ncbi:hypothetical protein BDW62DRAFT_220617 [Aspergillus aurantiobrunneus]
MLPEILSRVFWHLRHDPPTLQSALLVSKAWAAEATRILWENPPATALTAISPPRRQIYARQIRSLSFNGDEDGAQHSTFRDLEFPRLRCVTIDQFYPTDAQRLWLGQYIQPSLEEFSFYGAQPAEDLLYLLETRCPRLRRVLIDFVFEGVASARLVRFFDSCRALTSICLPGNMKEVIDGRLLAYLARRDGLEELELGTVLECAMLEEVFATERPFGDIRYLAVNVESRAVPMLVERIRSVRCLTLTLEDSQVNPLPAVSSLVDLQELQIGYVWQGEWELADLVALRQLKDLRTLAISPIYDPVAIPALTDDEFISVFADMSGLEELVLQVQCALSAAALTALAERCPGLVVCELPGRYDLRGWEDVARPLFPRLRRLELGAVVGGEG